MKRVLAAGAAAMLVLASAGAAGAATRINAFDYGWYEEGVGHDPSNTNTYTASGPGPAFRSFYAFDLSGAGPGPASTISITFRGGNGDFDSPDPEETVGLYDFTGSIDDLVNGTGGDAAFADLGEGVQVGVATVGPGPFGRMPEFTITLSSAFVAQYNSALASGDPRIALGAALLTGGDGEALWSGSGFIVPAAYLTIGTPTPEPAAWALMILGFGAAGAMLRRGRLAGA